MEILRALAVFIDQPLLAIVPAIIHFFVYAVSKSRLALLAGLLWLIYSPYEYGMKGHILCSGDCNIRVDLLFIYPILIIFSLGGIVVAATIMARKKHG